MRRVCAAVTVVLLLLAAGCGEPEVDLDVPPRAHDQHVLDEVGLLNEAVLAPGLAALRELGHDPAVLVFETDDAGLGTADRAGRKLIDAWDVTLVVVAVARPGDFARTDDERRRYFGVTAADVHAVPGSVRERIVEELVPPIAARNDWTEAVDTALRVLAEAIAEEQAPPGAG